MEGWKVSWMVQSMRGGKTLATYVQVAEAIIEHKASIWHRFHITLWGRRGREKELKARKKDLSKFLNKVGLRGRYKIKIWIPEPQPPKQEIFLDEWVGCLNREREEE